jgi:hypothetical protein
MPPQLSPYEKMKRVGIALGLPEDALAAELTPLRRKHLRVVVSAKDDGGSGARLKKMAVNDES